jgi:ribonuclease BN (tRNA processing enzyme)
MPDELLVLGSSSAAPTRRRFPSTYALSVTGKLFLLDCGAPVSTLLYHYDLDPMDVQAIFLSHWHMDHVANLGLLLSQNHQHKRSEALCIYGPRGTRGKVRRLLTDSFLLPEELNYNLNVTNIKPGTTYKEALLRVTFFKTQHLERPKLKTHFGRKAVACGMIINGPGWRVVYSGDIGSPTELVPYIKGCDLLIHELAHHRPEAVAEFVDAAKIPHVLISHLDPKFDNSPEKVVRAFTKRYQGDLIVAEDGMKVRLSRIRKKSKVKIKLAHPKREERQQEEDPVGDFSNQDQEENPNAVFVHISQNEFDLSPAISHQVLQTAREVLVGQTTTAGQRGQVGVFVASLKAPFNAPLTEMDRVEVVLTIDAGAEDADVEIAEGVTGLRRGRILRLLEEALEQDAVLTQEDLAWILNVNVRTIRRDIQVLKEEGHAIHTRGQLKGEDEIQLYKTRAIELWLDQLDPEEIARWLHHSLRAVKRFISMFLETVTLHQQEKPAEEIATIIQTSLRLVQDYLTVYETTLTTPRWQAKLAEELLRIKNPQQLPLIAPKPS